MKKCASEMNRGKKKCDKFRSDVLSIKYINFLSILVFYQQFHESLFKNWKSIYNNDSNGATDLLLLLKKNYIIF